MSLFSPFHSPAASPLTTHHATPHAAVPARLLRMCALLTAVWAGSAQAAEPASAPQASPATAPATPALPSDAASAALSKPPVRNSGMDGQLFYQILIAEVQSNTGEIGTAYQVYLEAARRHQISQLYQRAVEIALKGRAGEQALAAAKAWRQAMPQSREAAEYTAQILLAMGRSTDLAAPLRTLVQLTPTPQQPQLISTLPRTTARLSDKAAAAQVVDEATQPWRQAPLELAEAWVASAEAWTLARDAAKATASLNRALALKPGHAGAGMVALELISLDPKAEDLVKAQLSRPDASNTVRLAYARKLAGVQRFNESAEQLETLLKAQPELMGSWLTLAAVRLELKQIDKAEEALKPVLALEGKAQKPSPNAASTQIGTEFNDLEQAYLLMSQVADQRKQLDQASMWLDRADPKHEKLNIQAQRARLLFRQGKLADARKLIRSLPESEPRDAVTKYQAETQLLREALQWDEAYKVMDEASKRFPEDTDLMYDQAMLGEKLKKFADTERLLRKVMEMAPDNPNAFNALGYSFADRGINLPEAKKLINKALELRPGDPFITDSLGWVEFKAGNLAEAARILKEAYQARPDPEIAAHLGEVLWALGKQDEAKALWRDNLKGHGDSDTLSDTMKRFQVTP